MIANASPRRPQLLVSVQNASEARVALSLEVPWIDLKNPTLGSLGCPDLATARQVLDALAQPAQQCQTSVALGELETLNTETAIELLRMFPIAKVGLAGLVQGALGPLDELLQHQRSTGQLVLAAYADYQRAAAPAPQQVIELAGRIGARYVLVDTFLKDGLGLFHWQSPQQLAALGELAESIGAELVVAGSLRSTDWPSLDEAAPAIVGVRGGVCTADRASQLCPERIAQWLEWTQA